MNNLALNRIIYQKPNFFDTAKSQLKSNECLFTHESSDGSNKDISLFLSVIKNINRSLNLEDTFELILMNAIKLTNYKRGYIILINDDFKLEISKSLGNNCSQLNKQLSSIYLPIVKTVIQDKDSNYFITDDNLKVNIFKELENSWLIKTVLCAPLISGEENFGVLYIDTDEEDLSADENLEKIEFLAEQLSTSIKNFKLNYEREKTLAALTELNHQLALAKETTGESDKIKSEFLANVSHEIRTPVNVIINYIDMLKDRLNKYISKDEEFCFNIIQSDSKRLIRTIDLILNVAQVKSGKCEVHQEKINLLNNVLKNLILNFEEEAKEKNIDLILVDKAKDKNVYADLYCMEQIFSNLIDNAIKFTDTGFVKIELFNEGDELVVTIEDSGKGMSKEYQDKIFTPFNQEENGLSRSYEGNGLGLTLVNEYVQLNNGKLEIKSNKGAGSIFTVKLKCLEDNSLIKFR